MDRLIALVGLRLRLELRALIGARGRALGLLLALPALAIFSALASIAAFGLVRVLDRAQPELLLPVLSAVATLFGLSFALSPLLAGIAATESHDLTRLLPYPVSLRTLVLSTLVANLIQPTVLAQLPPLVALALALGGAARALPALAALALGLLLLVAAAQTTGLVLHALSRNRRLHDRAIFVGILLGVVLSLAPLLLLGAGGSLARRLLLTLLRHDVFALSPFAWSVRAAVHAGRGEALAFVALCASVGFALAACLVASTLVARRLYAGALDSGEGVASVERSWLRLPGTIGALVEKELRVVWRDPRLKAMSFSGVIGPLLILFLLGEGRGGGVGPGQLFAVAQIAGLGAVGANVLGVERLGLGLLLSFPVDRLTVLVGKNLSLLVLRGPVLVALALATLLLAGLALIPAVLVLLLSTELIASAADNYLSILYPVPLPAAGHDPNASVAGTRGLSAAAMGFLAMIAALAASAPFAFLVWLPYLLGEPWLWTAALPLALAGAGGVYFLAAGGAARLLLSREPELLARLRGED